MAAASGPNALVMRNQPLAVRDRVAAQASPQQSPIALEPAEVEALAKDSSGGAVVARLTQSTDTTPPRATTKAPVQNGQGHPDQQPEHRY
jgi:hypothetical protein